MNDKDENDIIKSLEQKVKQSGHLLEIKTENIFKGNFNVEREVPYKDKDESIGRNIDLIARAQIPIDRDEPVRNKQEKLVVGQIIFVIECKNLPNYQWVFFAGTRPELSFPDKVTLADYASPQKFHDPTIYYTPIQPVQELFFASGFDQYVLDFGKDRKQHNKQGRDQPSKLGKCLLYDAIMKVTKATSYKVDKMQDLICNKMLYFAKTLNKITAFAVIQPLIVFQGHMYSATVIREETKLQPIKYAQISKRYVSPNYYDFLLLAKDNIII